MNIKTLLSVLAMPAALMAQEVPDSIDVLAYSSFDGKGGLKLAWRAGDAQPWQPLGYTFVNSDFGPWGSHKTMFAPVLEHDGSQWVLTWVAERNGYVMAEATSPDLLKWSPQTYAMSQADRTRSAQYAVAGEGVLGNVVRMPKAEVDGLIDYVAVRRELDDKYAETMAGDSERFASLGASPLKYTVKAEPKKAKPISDMLIGIFFEDINYAADGGLYAELVQNRDFEYQPSDRGGDKGWNATTAWSWPAPEKGSYEVATASPIHENNKHYLSLSAREAGYAIANHGYDGMALSKGLYDLNLKARGNASITASLVDAKDHQLASKKIAIDSKDWKDYSATFDVARAADGSKLVLTFDAPGQASIDMVSLFPQATFKGRKNGLRADLAQTLADLHPRFVRFPGGCVAHGDGIDNIYDWKGSVGPLEARKPLRNLWGYHQTRGLGYHEYFQFCEDIGAEPLPVLAAGVPCQNSGTNAHHSHDALTRFGQQCGIPMEEMGQYVQDVLDLIEYANGPADSKWGALRAQAGHPEPFGLKYIGIGNEDMITEVFEERFKMIYDAVKAAHPEVEVVGTVGPFYEGTDYERGWELAKELQVPYVDEHYYVSPGWMIYNQDYYDGYERGEGATRVYLGEYAAHLDGRPSNIETALAEALYLTSVERNADVVAMTSYAPLLAKDGHIQWRPDLIYFSNTDVRPTVDYYVQQLYGQNSGSLYIPAAATLGTDNEKAAVRVGSSIVKDEATGDIIVKLANLLPVPVDASVDLAGLKFDRKKTPVATVIAGHPDESEAAPRSVAISAPKSGKLAYEMPAYSFTVVRLRK